ncbi:hypothetical protein C4552_01555 [Candidatus Parcubacteria bacterium]|nr:MAG: hypothetical protein C4552_01555 [Candidatus Parcubacteria bacterium]
MIKNSFFAKPNMVRADVFLPVLWQFLSARRSRARAGAFHFGAESGGENGNIHEYVYYHCTKKSKLKCPEPCIRQEELDRQLSSLIQKFSLRPDWAEEMRGMLEKEKSESAQSATAFVQEAETKIRAIQTKLQRLLDGYLEQDIEREIYRTEKAKLLSEKKSLEEQMARIEQKRTGWLEPMMEWIKEAENLPEIARESNLFAKKVTVKEIFGSNLVLANREARLTAPSGEDLSGESVWAALRAATEMVGQIAKSQILVRSAGIQRCAPRTRRGTRLRLRRIR